MQKAILVTGASGFLGAQLCADLLQAGYYVIGIGRKDAHNLSLSPRERGFLETTTLQNPRFNYMRLELKNIDNKTLKNLKEYRIESCFHLASMVEYASHNYHNYHNYTITPTLKCIALAKALQIPHIIFSSTSSVIAAPTQIATTPTNEATPISPMTNYGLAKFVCEKLLEFATFNPHTTQSVLESLLDSSLDSSTKSKADSRVDSGLDSAKKQAELAHSKAFMPKVVCLRFPAIFGRNHLGGIIYDLAKEALQGHDIELYNKGENLRNILYVTDATKALILAMQHIAEWEGGYHLFQLGSRDSQSVHTIAQLLVRYLHSSSHLILSTKPSPNNFNAILDTTKAQQMLHFKPMSIEEGIQAYCQDILEKGLL